MVSTKLRTKRPPRKVATAVAASPPADAIGHVGNAISGAALLASRLAAGGAIEYGDGRVVAAPGDEPTRNRLDACASVLHALVGLLADADEEGLVAIARSARAERKGDLHVDSAARDRALFTWAEQWCERIATQLRDHCNLDTVCRADKSRVTWPGSDSPIPLAWWFAGDALDALAAVFPEVRLRPRREAMAAVVAAFSEHDWPSSPTLLLRCVCAAVAVDADRFLGRVKRARTRRRPKGGGDTQR